MKAVLSLGLAIAAFGAGGHALANARLAEAKQCMQCHAVDRTVIGPSFQRIAAIYRRMDHPQAKLVAVIRGGSDAHLGPMSGSARMPDDSERPPVSDREARQLARWILSQRPSQ